jgi:hypothetical protein
VPPNTPIFAQPHEGHIVFLDSTTPTNAPPATELDTGIVSQTEQPAEDDTPMTEEEANELLDEILSEVGVSFDDKNEK